MRPPAARKDAPIDGPGRGIMPHDERHWKAGIILTARIKYQEAAGLEVKWGRLAAGPAPSKADLVKLYVKEEQSVRDVSVVLGCSKDAIHRALQEYGIAARPNASRSRLRTISLHDLEAAIRDRGISGTSRDLLKSSRPLLFERARATGSVRTRFPGLPHPHPTGEGRSARTGPKSAFSRIPEKQGLSFRAGGANASG